MHAATSFDQLARVLAGGAASLFGCPAIALVPTIGRRHPAGDGDDRAGRRSWTPRRRSSPAALTAAATHGGPDRSVRRGSLPSDSPGDPGWEAFLVGNRTGHAPLCVAVQAPRLQPDQASLLTQLGQAAVLAANSLRLYTEEHSLALTLQHSFLPDRAPQIPGLEIAVRYVPAATTAEIGGDFYDVIELDDDRLLIAIGDVAGHSIHAATVMVELRHALRAYAVEGHEPSEIVSRLERMLLPVPPHRVRHPVPAAAGPARRPAACGERRAPPAADRRRRRRALPGGVRADAGSRLPKRPAHGLPLPPHWSVVLITDGLIEEPGVDLDTAMEELRAAVPLDTEPEQLCTALLKRYVHRQDDIALLVLRKPPAG